ncbi:DUF6504 family protein [Sphingosinicella rhizophila]|uniref:DNA-directed DNA polymerase n=1 Tax=Sphingosinicella rhizophila TaxID=3050082 RepID=A0ABU3Q7C6_9SPHN|nr:DUF6504 family protein [Sphingosinicella sp. GR2756]MDT9599207.1 DNA polymerase Y family protein [Sphingosinicella sp. GR2756]
MPRVASLYLPYLPTDRLRPNQAKGGRPDLLDPALLLQGREAVRRRAEGLTAKEIAPPLTPPPLTRSAFLGKEGEEMEDGRPEDCSCPRGGGWRPGARWAREERQKQIDALPRHQRPPMRELGRRTEAARIAFHDISRADSALRRAEEEEKPLVTVEHVGQRMTIAAACPVARRLGAQPGMPLARARAFLPGLEVVDADRPADAAFLDRLAFFAARRWTPRAAVSGPDGLWLDLEGVAHLFGGEENMGVRILHFCARLGLAARIAVADTPGAAHALARYGAEPLILCPSGREHEAIAPLPIAALRVEEEVLGAARRLGLERIADLVAMPRAPLGRRFGALLLTRLDQALGHAGEAIRPILPLEPPSSLLRFAEPIATPEAIGEALRRLVASLVGTLTEQGLAARRLEWLCDRIDGRELKVAVGMARATRDADHLLSLLAAKIETIEPGYGIETMRLVARRCERLAPAAIHGALAGDAPAPDLAPLIDRLAGRLGARRLFRLSAMESDVPERSLRRIPPLDEASDWPRQWPRPVRLLACPEPIEKVVALLPDGPPRRFTWRGKAHAVARADGPERIYGEWWRRPKETESVRDYFQVEDEAGARFWIFRRGDGIDPRTGDLSWHLHGLFG